MDEHTTTSEPVTKPDPSPTSSTTKTPDKQSKKRTEKPAPPLPVESTAERFVTSLLDKSLQRVIYQCSADGEDFKKGMLSLVALCDTLLGKFRARFPCGDNPRDFGYMLEATSTVARCGLDDPARHPLPSVARTALQTLQIAAQTDDNNHIWKTAFSMTNTPAGKAATDRAKKVAAVGLQDQASDKQFESLVEQFEQTMQTAYDESISTWIRQGDDGGPRSMGDYTNFLVLSRKTATEVIMIIEQWSKSRLEERSEELLDVAQGLTMVCSCATWVAAVAFDREFPDFVCLLPQSKTMSSAEGSAVEGSEVKAEMAEASDAVHDVLPPGCLGVVEYAQPMLDSNIEQPDLRSTTLTEAIPAFERKVANFMEILKNSVSESARMVSAIEAKLGEVFRSAATEESPKDVVQKVASDVDLAAELFESIINYIRFTVELQGRPNTHDTDASVLPADRNAYLKTLSGFCALHKKLALGVRIPHGDFVDEDMLTDVSLSTLVGHWVDTFGTPTFKTHVEPAIATSVRGMSGFKTKINPLQPSTVQRSTHNCLRLFSMLVEDDMNALAAVPHTTNTGGSDAFRTNDWVHNLMLESLRELVAALQVERLEFSAMGRPNDERPTFATEMVMTFFELLVHIRDVACFGAAVVQHISRNQVNSEAKTMDLTLSTQMLPKLCAGFGVALAELDVFLGTDRAAKLEAHGLFLSPSFESARVWRQDMALLRSRCIDTILQEWVTGLTSAASAAQVTCPAWAASCPNDDFDELMAMSLVKGKIPVIIAAYNTLHRTLSDYSAGATLLDLTPRLQSHPLTKAVVAVAMHNLSALKDAATFAKGVELYASVRNSPSGPAEVATFLQSNPPASRSSIPTPFWRFLEAFVAGATPATERSTKHPRPDELGTTTRRPAVKRQYPEVESESTVAGDSAPADRGSAAGAKLRRCKSRGHLS